MAFKKFSYVSAAIVAAFSVSSASAGTLTHVTSGGTVFAAETFGSSSTAATGVKPGLMTYSFSSTSGIYVGAGGAVYVYLRLANGATFSTLPLKAQFTGTLLNVGGADNFVITSATMTLSSDSTTVMIPVVATAAATIGVGTTLIYTPIAGAISGVKTALSAVGGTVSATLSTSVATPAVVSPSTTTSPNSTTTQPTDLEASGTAVIAKAVQGVATAISALPTYTGKIDLTSTPTQTNYASTPGTALNVARLGSVKFTDATTAGNGLDGATPVTTAAAVTATSTTITVTPGTGQSFAVGSKLAASVDGCANMLTGTAASPTLTASTAAAAVTLTPLAANVLTGGAIDVCMTVPSTGNTATAVTPTITASLNHAGNANTTGGISTGTGTGYALTLNGASIDVNSYWGAAVKDAGYSSYVRVINTGTIAAPVSIAYINATTGVVGTSAVVITSLPAGASKMLKASEIEAIVGAQPNGYEAGRLRISAPTTGLKTQSFLQADSGKVPPIELSGAQ